MPAETSQTLGRGLDVLALLARSPYGLSISEIATAVGVNRTVVYRLVATLEERGLARRDGGGRFHIGLGVLGLARGLQPVLREIAAPVLRALANEVGATAHLTVAEGEEALAVAVVEPSWTDFHVSYRVGARHSLSQGAAGKAILLGRSIAGDGPAAQEYVETVGELQPGARGLAAPVTGVDGLEASVGIVTLAEVSGDLDAAVVGRKVSAAAAELARRLA